MSGIEAALNSANPAEAERLLWPALAQYPTVAPLWFYAGNVMVQTGRDAVALICYRESNDLEPNPYVLANLGAIYRRLNRTQEGRNVLDLALFRDPTCLPALVNRGTIAVNNGNPAEGIPYLEAAMAAGKDRAADWNLGLLYLESGRFAEGFDLYHRGIGHERYCRSYAWDQAPEPKLLEPDDPREGKTLIVWGEQGIGDELMYGTLIEEARRDFGEVIFDCHPRLEQLHRWSHPTMRIFPTRKSDTIYWPPAEDVHADYKAPIGELARLYRRDRASFTWKHPTYTFSGGERAEYRKRLKDAAQGRSIVGLALRGGVMSTARQERTIRADTPLPLFKETEAFFVGLDYEDVTDQQSYIEGQVGAGRYSLFPSITHHWDYHHTAALVAACDLVVTVCQSVAHLAAGMGKDVRVLVPSKCAWRYGLEEEAWYWYPGPHAKLYRQDRDTGSWEKAVSATVADIQGIRS